MIDPRAITLAKNKFDLFIDGQLKGVEVENLIGIEEGPEVGDEIKIFEATFNDQTFVYDEYYQETIIGKVSDHDTVLHLAKCDEGYHLFFATYDVTVDLFGDYVFLGMISETKPETPIKPGLGEYVSVFLKFVQVFLTKDRL